MTCSILGHCNYFRFCVGVAHNTFKYKVSLQTTTTAVKDYEVDHKRVLIEKILTFGPCKYFVYDEVILDCEWGHVAPSGNIDLVSCENDQNDATNLVAIQTCPSSGPQDRSNVLSTSAKRDSTYNEPGSDRQVIVEL